MAPSLNSASHVNGHAAPPPASSQYARLSRGPEMQSPVPFDEVARLEALHRYELSENEGDPLFDNLVAMAAVVCRTPIAHIGLLDHDRLWIKSGVGLARRRVPRHASFSAYAICKKGEVLVVPDTRRDCRFAHNPLLALDPPVRFCAAAPLIEPSGYAIGTIVIMDYEPRTMSAAERLELRLLAQHGVALLEYRQQVRRLERELSERTMYERRIAVLQHQLVATNAALCIDSLTDSLSQLGNRRAFDQHLAEEVQRARRLLYPVSLLMIDIDYFKQFNDAYGHPLGDQIIQCVAKVLGQAVRTTDFVARLGGDEFAAILPGTDLHGARIMAERCRIAIENERWPHEPVRISVGIGQLSPGAQDGSALVDDADRSLLNAKQNGRNRVATLAFDPFYEPLTAAHAG